jgi:hypothetical protein
MTGSCPLPGWSRDHRPGRKPALDDAELLCRPWCSTAGDRQRAALDPVRAPPPGPIPRLPGQSGYGKLLRASGGLLSAMITELARDTASWWPVMLRDGLPS